MISFLSTIILVLFTNTDESDEKKSNNFNIILASILIILTVLSFISLAIIGN